MKKLQVTKKVSSSTAYFYDGTLECARELMNDLSGRYDEMCLEITKDGEFFKFNRRIIEPNNWFVLEMSSQSLIWEPRVLSPEEFQNRYDVVT